MTVKTRFWTTLMTVKTRFWTTLMTVRLPEVVSSPSGCPRWLIVRQAAQWCVTVVQDGGGVQHGSAGAGGVVYQEWCTLGRVVLPVYPGPATTLP